MSKAKTAPLILSGPIKTTTRTTQGRNGNLIVVQLDVVSEPLDGRRRVGFNVAFEVGVELERLADAFAADPDRRRELNLDVDVSTRADADDVRRDAEVRAAVFLLHGREGQDVALEDGLVVGHGRVVLPTPVNFRRRISGRVAPELDLLAFGGNYRPFE